MCDAATAVLDLSPRGRTARLNVLWKQFQAEQADTAKQYLRKGSKIYVERRIQTRDYKGKDGTQKTAYEIVASDFRMLDGKTQF